jgi:hypothetical protein
LHTSDSNTSAPLPSAEMYFSTPVEDSRLSRGQTAYTCVELPLERQCQERVAS